MRPTSGFLCFHIFQLKIIKINLRTLHHGIICANLNLLWYHFSRSNIGRTIAVTEEQNRYSQESTNSSFNPFTPKIEKCILSTFYEEMYK